MKRIALYIRTSRDRQALGLKAQERSLRDYLNQNEVRFSIKNYKIELYIDENRSGKLASRPSFDRMLEAARNNELSYIMVYSYSRLARSLRHLLEIESELRSLELPLISLTDSVDTSTPTGRLVFQLIASVSEFESSIASERTKNALASCDKQLGRPKHQISPESLIKMRAAGMSYRVIAKKLSVSPSTIYKHLKEHLCA